MSMMIANDFAEEVPAEDLNVERNKWYIVHHGVYHKQKDKIRVVFNCSLKYGGGSLNEALLQGPDLTNNLLGVLLTFRQGSVAVMGDLEKMFYQVRVPQQHRDFLRYFWYPGGDPHAEPIEYRLKVHVFGAVSSPSCANFALRKAANDCATNENFAAVQVVQNHFYVDDMLVSFDTVETSLRSGPTGP
jgi:hypothetical protein